MNVEIDEEYTEDDEGIAPQDPFEGLTRSEQDLFFRVLDLIPDEHRTDAIDYFMDHPEKIRAVVDGVKMRKELIKDKDTDGLDRLLEEERIVFQKLLKDEEEEELFEE